jgi:hypothetical protein
MMRIIYTLIVLSLLVGTWITCSKEDYESAVLCLGGIFMCSFIMAASFRRGD